MELQIYKVVLQRKEHYSVYVLISGHENTIFFRFILQLHSDNVTWDLVCTLACSGFTPKGVSISTEVCPSWHMVSASRGPRGQDMPWTCQLCRVETGKLTVSNHSHYSLEQKFQNFNLKIPENPLALQWKRPITKKSINKTPPSSICTIESPTAFSLCWYNNQASPEKEKPVLLAIHTARVNIHPNALFTITFSINFTSKNGKEEE